jgi:uncharacterized membrane protein YecN with MAPEG domain
MPHITLFYAGILALLYFALSMRVVRFRQTLKIGIGDAGNHAVQRAIRVHANLGEYVPLILVLFGLLEQSGLEGRWMHGFGAALVLSRLLHAWSLSQKSGISVGRFVGTTLTFGCLVIGGILAIWYGMRG